MNLSQKLIINQSSLLKPIDKKFNKNSKYNYLHWTGYNNLPKVQIGKRKLMNLSKTMKRKIALSNLKRIIIPKLPLLLIINRVKHQE